MNNVDVHIHLEQGDYSLHWVNEFVKVAAEKNLDEIWLLEHCYQFREFVPMYDSVCAYSKYIDKWFRKKAGTRHFDDYLRLQESVQRTNFPIKIKFGLEICYFQKFERFIFENTKDKGLDFLVGSVHFIDDFAFDHKPEHWQGIDVDRMYRRYFETSIDLAQSGIFDGIAHPDLIKIFGHTSSFSLDEYYKHLAASLSKNNMYAEQNSGAYRRSPETAPLGMNPGLIREMKLHGVKSLTASDAHCPEDVGARIKEMETLL